MFPLPDINLQLKSALRKIFILPNINLQLKSALRTKYVFYQSLLYLVTPAGYDRTWSNKSIAKGTTDPGVGFFCLSERLNLINNSKGAALHIQQSGAQGTLLGEEDTKMEALVAIKW